MPLPVTADGLCWLDDSGCEPITDEHGRLLRPFVLTFRDEHSGKVIKAERFMTGCTLPTTPAALTLSASVRPKREENPMSEATTTEQRVKDAASVPPASHTKPAPKPSTKVSHAAAEKGIAKKAAAARTPKNGSEPKATKPAAAPKAEQKPTAKKGDTVRIVHRPTDEKEGGPEVWRIWEAATNKMVVRQAFDSMDAAAKFADAQGWKPVLPRKAQKAAATA